MSSGDPLAERGGPTETGSLPGRYLRAVRNRAFWHCLAFFVAWPVFTIVSAATELRRIPYYIPDWTRSLGAATAGLGLLAPQFLVVGGIVAAASLAIFAGLSLAGAPRARPRAPRLVAEAATFFLALLLGTLVWFPGVASSAALGPFAQLPLAGLLALLASALLLSCRALAHPGAGGVAFAVLAAAGLLVPLLPFAARPPAPRAGTGDIVVLGLDSVAAHDDVTELRRWVARNDGSWYREVTAPGLLTNAVWASVLTGLGVGEHRVFHTFQPFPRRLRPAPLLRAARRNGYRTVAFFPDQLTCAVGSEAGFDEDRSGPAGWRQLVTTFVANSSVLVPVVAPALPRLPMTAVPPNHAGTFSYDLRRELREILRTDGRGPRFVAAHLTCLHLPRYPAALEMSWDERAKVARARSGAIRDRSFDWQDAGRADDPIPLRAWKLNAFQKAIVDCVSESGLLDRGGTCVVFSDHGDRLGLDETSFTERRYHQVVLAILGRSAGDVAAPVSLRSLGAILGLGVGNRDRRPAVEFAIARPEEWATLAEDARLEWNGAVRIPERYLATIFARLKIHHPDPRSDGGPTRGLHASEGR